MLNILFDIKDYQEFSKYYWYREELKQICKKIGVANNGTKQELNYYIEQGGGFASRAKKRRVFIVYMNGTVQKSKTFSKAKAAPGCEIIVPVKPPRKGVGLAEIMSIASSTTSMAALVTSIINSTK